MWSPKHIVRAITFRAASHQELGGHSNIEININPEPVEVEEINCEVTVNK